MSNPAAKQYFLAIGQLSLNQILLTQMWQLSKWSGMEGISSFLIRKNVYSTHLQVLDFH